MQALSLISNQLPPLKTSDSGEKALAWMADFHVRHLPLIKDGNYLGMIAEENLWDLPDIKMPVGQLVETDLKRPFVLANHHLYDVMKAFVDNKLTSMPVLALDGKYQGLVTMENLLKYFADTFAVTHPGAVVIIEMDYRDYSLSEIARIVESEKAVILSSFVSSPHGTTKLELTLKINKQDLKHVAATLERFGYKVMAQYDESDMNDALKERYEMLMNYLDI